MKPLRIGTRGSALALWQANRVADLLRERHDGLDVELKIIATEGDTESKAPIAQLGGTGVFVRRIESVLTAGEIDLAVHSLKDLPTDQPDGLALAAILERHDPRDALLSVDGWTIDTLPRGTVVGTGSPRRRCQILHRRPDLEVVPIRGNVDTRVRKLREGQVGAIVLAVAGVERLGIDSVPMVPIEPFVCLPAVGQGAVAVEIREDDERTRSLVRVIDHEPTAEQVEAERSFLRTLGGGCLAPATAFARTGDGRVRVQAVVGSADGDVLLSEQESGVVDQARAIGARLANRLLVAGAATVLREVRDGEPG